MKVVKEITVAGQTIFVKVKVRKAKKAEGEKRAVKEKATPEQIEKINQKNAERHLAISMNYNLKPGDYHNVFTYSGNLPTKDQMQKDLEKLKRDLTKLYKGKGITLKWYQSTEWKSKRPHHHIVMSGGVDLFEIAKVWGKGFIRPVHLDDTGDYRKLAAYLIKETSKTFREEGAISRRRYSCSRTVEHPMSNQDENVSYQEINREPKAPKGYYIDPESIFRGRNPITGLAYLEYVMISLSEEARIKRWNRGKRVKLRPEYYKVNNYDQVEMDLELMQSA
jgi:hypothetical protein